MWNRPQADAIDPKWIYRTYAGVMGLAGFMVVAWGPMWLGVDLPGMPFGRAALVRVFGSLVMAGACFAAALADVEEPRARRRGSYWFMAAHMVVFIIVTTQRTAVWGDGREVWLAQVFFGAALVFAWLLATADGQFVNKLPRPLSLFGADSTALLRSRYEQQIREAAGQEERRRLARELHDSIKQQIFVVQTAAAAAQARFDADAEGTKQALAAVRSAAREAMGEMEAMLDQLQAAPLENAGLVEALKKQCEALGFRTGAEVRFTPGELPPSEAFAPGAQQAIYRVAQEALANVGRHARAAHVNVGLASIGSQVVLRVEDDGGGFDTNVAPRGMGLRNMRARAEEYGGLMETVSRPGAGTVVELRIPFDSPEPDEWKRYRASAMVNAVVLLVGVPFLLREWPKRQSAWVALIAAIMFVRSIIGWRRLKRR